MSDGLKRNYYALLICILTRKSVNQALSIMRIRQNSKMKGDR